MRFMVLLRGHHSRPPVRRGVQVTVFDYLNEPEVKTIINPCFTMDKAMIFCGTTGRILANKWGVSSIENGIQTSGTKLQVSETPM